jgi:hypothetical protein
MLVAVTSGSPTHVPGYITRTQLSMLRVQGADSIAPCLMTDNSTVLAVQDCQSLP